jgi:hypothetical protein
MMAVAASCNVEQERRSSEATSEREEERPARSSPMLNNKQGYRNRKASQKSEVCRVYRTHIYRIWNARQKYVQEERMYIQEETSISIYTISVKLTTQDI